jgi:hypothetical protein
MADDLAAAIEDLVASLDGIARHKADSAEEFRRGSVVFAVLDGPELIVRLRPELADAAVQTPDTARSGRGSAWISLRPATLDGFALDRARAWFESAWRFAEEP